MHLASPDEHGVYTAICTIYIKTFMIELFPGYENLLSESAEPKQNTVNAKTYNGKQRNVINFEIAAVNKLRGVSRLCSRNTVKNNIP